MVHLWNPITVTKLSLKPISCSYCWILSFSSFLVGFEIWNIIVGNSLILFIKRAQFNLESDHNQRRITILSAGMGKLIIPVVEQNKKWTWWIPENVVSWSTVVLFLHFLIPVKIIIFKIIFHHGSTTMSLRYVFFFLDARLLLIGEDVANLWYFII